MKYQLGPVSLYHGDCREVLRSLPDNSVDSVPTDPPYALVSIVKRFGSPDAAPAKGNDAYMRASAGFMGKQWDTGETAFSVEFWAEVFRVLKPGGFVAAFGASRGYHRMACAIEDAGFEIRDSLMWLYGTGFPKSHDVSKGIDRELGAERDVIGRRTDGRYASPMAVSGRSAGIMGEVVEREAPSVTAPATPQAAEWEGWGTALKPAFEPIVLARKPLSEGTVAANVLRWRTGAMNIDASRIAAEERPLLAHTGRDGNVYGSGLEGSKAIGTTTQGRWPANVVTDGSDEVVGLFPRQAGASAPVRGDEPSEASTGNVTGKRARVAGVFHNDSGSAARFFYSAKASKADRAGSKHPTVKPVSLIEWLATLITPPGGTILDPFAGSGTAGAAARNRGFRAILIEREAEYVADIRKRLGDAPVADLASLIRAHAAKSEMAAELQKRLVAA
jgi:DNA modification methylase